MPNLEALRKRVKAEVGLFLEQNPSHADYVWNQSRRSLGLNDDALSITLREGIEGIIKRGIETHRLGPDHPEVDRLRNRAHPRIAKLLESLPSRIDFLDEEDGQGMEFHFPKRHPIRFMVNPQGIAQVWFYRYGDEETQRPLSSKGLSELKRAFNRLKPALKNDALMADKKVQQIVGWAQTHFARIQ